MSRRFDHHVYIVDRGPMVLTLLQVADAISKVHHPKWFIHERVLARKLGITLEQLHGVVQCLREGGVSSSSSNTFCPNPPPYDTKIDVFSGSEDNPLNNESLKHAEMEREVQSKREKLKTLFNFTAKTISPTYEKIVKYVQNQSAHDSSADQAEGEEDYDEEEDDDYEPAAEYDDNDEDDDELEYCSDEEDDDSDDDED